MLDAVNFVIVLAAFCASVALMIQVAACARPFRHIWERYAALAATFIVLVASLQTLVAIAADQFPVTYQTALTWAAALALISFLWAILGRFEKHCEGVGRKTTIFSDFKKT